MYIFISVLLTVCSYFHNSHNLDAMRMIHDPINSDFQNNFGINALTIAAINFGEKNYLSWDCKNLENNAKIFEKIDSKKPGESIEIRTSDNCIFPTEFPKSLSEKFLKSETFYLGLHGFGFTTKENLEFISLVHAYAFWANYFDEYPEYYLREELQKFLYPKIILSSPMNQKAMERRMENPDYLKGLGDNTVHCDITIESNPSEYERNKLFLAQENCLLDDATAK